MPTMLTIAAVVVGVVGFGVAAAVSGSGAAFGRAVVAAVIVVGVYLVLWRFAGMGLGDVRLAGALGLFAG
ncbi:prepilin peptidase [Oerskovia paurometabola]|uniref:prepilin peptidase n=1 Tax=Oerskovia paurometabola TaxID=162170 RepID=UPI00341720B8